MLKLVLDFDFESDSGESVSLILGASVNWGFQLGFFHRSRFVWSIRRLSIEAPFLSTKSVKSQKVIGNIQVLFGEW